MPTSLGSVLATRQSQLLSVCRVQVIVFAVNTCKGPPATLPNVTTMVDRYQSQKCALRHTRASGMAGRCNVGVGGQR